MKRAVALLTCCLSLPFLRAESPMLTLENTQLPSPAGVGATTPRFVRETDGKIVLGWAEPDERGKTKTAFSVFNSGTRAWEHPAPFPPPHALPLKSDDEGEAVVHHAGRVAKAWLDTKEKNPRM